MRRRPQSGSDASAQTDPAETRPGRRFQRERGMLKYNLFVDSVNVMRLDGNWKV